MSGQQATDTFTYRVSDGRGGYDTATVSIAIKGVNLKPVAKDDTDKVSTGGTTNGNVISGVDPDAPDKKLVLQADTKGDGTHILRSITHDGVTYTLNASKSAVSVSGSPAGAWSYNNATGDLTITTEIGGTLKINLDGDGSTPARTPGNYAYTAPASVQWGMPASDAKMGYGDSVSTWLGRFGAGRRAQGLQRQWRRGVLRDEGHVVQGRRHQLQVRRHRRFGLGRTRCGD